MSEWFIKIQDKDEKMKLTIYPNGTVYGKERGQKLGTLNSNAMKEIDYIIKDNLGDFRKLGYYNYNCNPFVLRINDTTKHRILKIIGWPQIQSIIRVVNKRNVK